MAEDVCIHVLSHTHGPSEKVEQWLASQGGISGILSLCNITYMWLETYPPNI